MLYNKDSEIQQLKEKVAEPAASEAPKDNAAESQEVGVLRKKHLVLNSYKPNHTISKAL